MLKVWDEEFGTTPFVTVTVEMIVASPVQSAVLNR